MAAQEADGFSNARDASHASDIEAKVERLEAELARQATLLARARQELSPPREHPAIVGRSPATAKVLALVDRVAGTTFPVLIEGEPGTGKELVARAIHAASPRRSGPFLVLDAGAIAGPLLEDELFGHARGAFAGAAADRAGLLELADGGTLLLDEVGALASEVQASLLRLLQDHEVRRAGGEEARKVDVRLIATTTSDLQRAVREGRFREDLYYRLAVLKLRLAPLRERPEDVPDLVRHLIAREARAVGREPPRIDADALEALARHDWPGNAREVELAARTLLGAGGETIARPAVDRFIHDARARRPAPPESAASGPATDALATDTLTLREIERAVIDRRLRAHHWHQKQTARSLGIDRKTLYRKIREYGLAIDGAGNLPPQEEGE